MRTAKSDHEILDTIIAKDFLWERLVDRLSTSPLAISWNNERGLVYFAEDGAMSLDLDSLADFVDMLCTRNLLRHFLGIAYRDTTIKVSSTRVRDHA